jgi:hypothetical protein
VPLGLNVDKVIDYTRADRLKMLFGFSVTRLPRYVFVTVKNAEVFIGGISVRVATGAPDEGTALTKALHYFVTPFRGEAGLVLRVKSVECMVL